MRRILHPALVLASAVAVATCADAPTGPRNARNGSLLHGRVAVSAQLTRSASETATRLTQFGFAIDNVGIILRRVVGDVVVLDTTIAVTPGQTLSLALPVTVTTVDEQFIARVVLRQGTTVLYAGEHRVGATLDGATTTPPPVVIEVEYAGPGASATRIRITPRDSVFSTTARPQFAITATDATGAAVPGVPVVWSTSDAALATVDASTGAVTPGNRRGSVTLRALALSGLTDTLPLTLLSPAASVAAVSGAGQTGTAGHQLAAPLVVQVLAADGLPAAGETVAFAAAGTGSITPTSATTDATGRASATIVLGAQLGEQQFTAAVQGLPAVTVVQHATAGAATSLARTSADTVHGIVGQTLAAALGVQVRDEFGLPVSGATVRWSLSGAGGVLAGDTSTTSAEGAATIGFTFGAAAGVSTVTATVGDVGVAFTLVAAAGAPAQLTVAGGDAQQAPPSTALVPFVVRLADQHGNPVAGQAVNWTRVAGSGTLDSATSITAADGHARTGYTTGAAAGTERVVASVGTLEATFTATTQAGAPALVTRIAGDGQAIVAGTVVPVRLKARVTDASGNGVASVVDIAVTAPGGATVTETGLATDSAGYVLVPLTLLERPRVAGTYTALVKLQASPATQAAFSLTVTPAPATAITLVAVPTSATSGVPLSPQPSLQLVDSLGNAVRQAGLEVRAATSGAATLSGTPTATTDAAGSATFIDLAIVAPAGTHSLAFSASGLAGTAASIAVASGPAAVIVRTTPDTARGIVGQPLAPPLGVQVRDASGVPVAGAVVRWTVGGAGGTLGAESSTTDTSGAATVGFTFGTAAGVSTVTASAGSASTSFTLVASADVPAQLSLVSGDGQQAPQSTALSPFVVRLADQHGNPIAGEVVNWTRVEGAGTLGATSSTTATDGSASAGYTTGTTAGVDRILASAAGFEVAFAATTRAGAPAAVARIAGDSQVVAAGTTVPVRLQARVTDASGNGVASVVDIAVTPPGDTAQVETGVATDSAGYVLVPLTLLERPRVAGTYTALVKLQASPATQAAFSLTVTPAPATAITLVAVPTSATSGVPLSPQPSLQLVDSLGNTSPTSGVAITASAGDSATLSGTPTASTDSTGRATFTDLVLTGRGTTTLSFAAPGMAGAAGDVVVAGTEPPPPPSLTVTPFGASQVRISQFHGSVGGLGVIVRDSVEAPVAGIAVHFTLAADGTHGTFAGGAVEAVVATDSAGVALFDGWIPPAPDGSYVVAAQAKVDGIAAGGPVAFTAIRSAWTYALSVTPESPVAGGVAEVSAALVDGSGTALHEAGRTVTWTSEAALGTQSSITDSLGVARVSVTAPPAPATVVVSASDSSGVAGATEFTTRSAGGSVTVTPQRDTLTSIGDTRQLAAALFDSSGAPATGSFTWVSRDSTAVTADTTGLVTAVANGSAWIVATDIGGISDSALVVVQQRVATVMVTPGELTLRLTGRQQFTAAAVDGRGHPIGSPAFSWASTAPAIASVDSTGAVEAIALGTASIRATSGGVTGVASLTVETPITRIAVGVDSSGIPVADATALPSLGAMRRFIAVAYDTLDNPMSGITFAWTSSNPSVAQLEGTTAASTDARAAANGLASIRATVHGVVGSASLTVQQALAAIQLSPASATIGVNGTVGTIARGLDANEYFISGGSFAFTSSNPSVATVGAASGVVTGIAVGTTTITAASGSITSPGATITVSASVPPVISFGRDTLSVGRGSSTSIPVFLSTPHASPVTVQLSVSDTIAYFNPATVTFAAGQTAVNATLVGRNAGNATVHAVDASSSGFAGDTAALAVQATLRMASTGYTLNATDSRETQVLLSDPSPPGGTYVTLTFGTSGVATASPNPAFIPEGQLAADVVITGTSTSTATATTSIVPSAIGVNGTSAAITVYPGSLLLSTNSVRLGAGQYREDVYAYVSTYQSTPVTLTLTSSDTSVVTVPPSVTIPANSYYAYFRTTARAPGSATISVSAPGWRSPTPLAMQVTTPRVTACCGASLTTTAPQRTITVYSTDSVGNAAWRTNSLVVRIVSRDSSIMRAIDSTVTIAAGQYYTNAGRVIPGGSAGSTWVVVEAGGHGRDSVQFTVAGPQLNWSSGTARIGAGQVDGGVYVYTPHNVTAPLELTITSSDSTIVATSTSATIPAGTYYHYLPIRGMSPGTATLTVSAPGYSPATMTYITTTPRISLSGGGTVNNFAPPRSITAYSTDSTGGGHNRQTPLTVRFASTDTTVLRVDTTGIIAAGSYYTNTPRVTFLNPGAASVIATADGHVHDTVTYTVVMPQLQFSSSTFILGAGQQGDPYVYTPDNRTSPLAITFTRTGGGVSTLPAADTIPTGTYYSYFGVAGLTAGVDTVVASADGYRPDTLVVRITTPKFTASGLPGGRTTTSPPFQVTVYATDSLGTGHLVTDTVVVEVTSSDTAVIRPAARYMQILPGTYYVQPAINIVGPGTATLAFTDTAGRYVSHTTAPMTVTGPSLAMGQASYRLGMGQTTGTTGVYVHVPNNVASPLVVTLTSTSTRVATVPATVTIPAGGYYAYFEVVAGDTVGTIQVQATATGYTPSAMTVQVTVPKFVISTNVNAYTTSAPRFITVYATDADGSARNVREAVTVTLASSAPGVATVDSVTVTIPAGSYYTNTAKWSPVAVGTAQITARDDRAVYQKYTTGAANVAVTTPPLTFGNPPTVLGLGQYSDGMYVATQENTASALTVTLSHVGTARTTTPASVTIPSGTYYTYFRTAALSEGVDTLVASAQSPAHHPDTVFTVVSKGRIDPIGNWPATLAVGDSVPITIYARDPQQTTRYLIAPTTWSLSHNGSIQFRSGGAAITSITIPANSDRITFFVKAVSAGTGTASFASTDYTTHSNSISVVTP